MFNSSNGKSEMENIFKILPSHKSPAANGIMKDNIKTFLTNIMKHIIVARSIFCSRATQLHFFLFEIVCSFTKHFFRYLSKF